MIEKIVMDYLADKLSCPVVMEVPADPAVRFVLLEKTGSGRSGPLKKAALAIQSYAESLYEAALLNDEVKAVMEDITDLDIICRAELNSDYNFTDTAAKRYRYQAVFDLIHY